MDQPDDRTVHESPARFDENRVRAAAVYCSDGRFGEHFDDFLHTALKLPRYDRLAVPGGAACLAGHFLAFREEEGMLEQLRFLVKVHGLERLVLIAHQDSRFTPSGCTWRRRSWNRGSGKMWREPQNAFTRSPPAC